MKKVFVLSRKEFENEIPKLSTQDIQLAFISIHDPGKPRIVEDAPNILNLWFHDAEDSPDGDLTLFSDEMATKIANFVKNNQNSNIWMVHCTAGISRSGAVGETLAEFLGIPYKEFKRTNPRVQPNILVKKLLGEKLLQTRFKYHYFVDF